jgi:hypothetical protein
VDPRLPLLTVSQQERHSAQRDPARWERRFGGRDKQNFVDSHGASFVGFGIIRLLDFDLIARFKQINTMKPYVPGPPASTPTPCSRRR